MSFRHTLWWKSIPFICVAMTVIAFYYDWRSGSPTHWTAMLWPVLWGVEVYIWRVHK